MPAVSGGGRLRRTWPQRLLIVFNSFAILAALASAGLVAYGKRTVSDIPRVLIAGPGVQPPEDLEPGAPQNFLLVGVDSDEGLAADDPIRDGRDGSVEGLRSDTIMIVRIDPGAGEARILSFPRDLWVDIPGFGRNRINSAIQYGKEAGPNLLIETIKVNFDIDINHYVQVNFAGFKNVISQINGVQVYLPNPVRDGYSGLNQPEAGCVTLDADQALAYARSRHLQYQVEGRWIGDPTSDLGRISRQQDFTRRVIRQALGQGATNPATLRRMVENGVKSITLDDFTTPEDLIVLGRAFRDYDPEELISYALPVVDVVRDGAKVLDLIEQKAEPILGLFQGTGSAGGTATAILPGSVTVRVLNGTGTVNQGAETTNALAVAGFTVRSPGNDTAERFTRTEVRYRVGQEAEATLVARYLGADPEFVADDTVEEITVVTGDDLTPLRTTPRDASSISIPAPVASTSTTSTSSSTSSPVDAEVAATSPTTAVRTDPGVSVGQPEGFLPGAPPDGSSCG